MKKTLIVLMVLLSAMLVLTFAVSCNPEQEEKVEVGGTIERGTYPATAGETYAGKPITWKVLAITDGRALVISEKLLTSKAHASESGHIAWADSLINKWLNDTSADGFIAQYGLGDVSIAQVGNVNGKVFLLTKTEAGTYFSDDASRVATDLSGKASRWWLSSLYGSNYYDSVRDVGDFDSGGSPVHYANGVRPAFWINL